MTTPPTTPSPRRTVRVGDIVRTPAGGLYGDLPAIVLAVARHAVTVHTGSAELCYEPADVTPLAIIEVTKRSYRTLSGNRFRVCIVRYHDGTTKEQHVQVRTAGDLGEETRALEIRKRLFAAMARERAQ